MKNIVLIGATGNIGSRILAEALSRGFPVTAVARDTAKLASRNGLRVVKGDALRPEAFAEVLRGADALVGALSPSFTDPKPFVEANKALARAVAEYGVGRFIVVGGASTTLNEKGVRLFDTGAFPPEWKPYLQAHVDTLDFLKESKIAWTYFSPAMTIEAGIRTGVYRAGGNAMLKDAAGNSRISYEDYAAALVDELESGANIHAHFTAAY
ncbi:MAG: NAD(P)H-binding protein [Treponemataceae bacterium]